MVPSKSSGLEMLESLFREIFVDFTVCYPERSADFARDSETVMSRLAAEGVQFLTVALPSLGKAVDEAFGTNTLVIPKGFKAVKGQKIPAFLQALFCRVFEPITGVLRVDACPIAVKHLRQVLFLAYRYEFPFTQEQQDAVVTGFVATELELAVLNLRDAKTEALLEEARVYVCSVLSGFDPKDIKPRHGPGAVATGEKLESKWVFSRLYDDLHQQYPYYDYFVVGGANELSDRLEWYRQLERIPSGTAKVVLVPKDSRGPRLISMEPLEYQYIQQGIARKLVSHIETHHLSRGNVNFRDQSINQQLAIEASCTGRKATIDLKDASDRVSVDLVIHLFPLRVVTALMAARTTATTLPDGKVLAMKKFAPMGSALCFPVEALCFWAIAAAVVRRKGYTREQAASLVQVYGDDIIVPTRVYWEVVEALELCGLKVNKSKCFHTGPFRESCGADAFKGVLVTPVKFRCVWSNSPSDAKCYASWVSYANELATRGYSHMAEAIWKAVVQVYGEVPYGTSRSSYPCRMVLDPTVAEMLNESLGMCQARYNTSLQRWEYRVRYLANAKVPSVLTDWPRLLRDLLALGDSDPSEVVVPHTTVIKRGWKPIY